MLGNDILSLSDVEARGWVDLVRYGKALPVLPTTDTGYKLYGPGRLMLPAGTCLCPDPQGTALIFWPADTAHTDFTANQALPTPIADQPLITKCLKMVNDGTADAPVTANMVVVASTSYNSSLYVFAPTLGGNLTITAENGHSFTVAALTGASAGWTRYSVQSNTVAGEIVLGLKFTFAGGGASTVYVTGYNPLAAGALTPYFDGAYPDCSWSGAANASTSVRAASVLDIGSLPVTLNHLGGAAARFCNPTGLTAIGTDLYVAEYGNHCIRRITSAGVVTTFAGTTGATSGHVDDTGTAARFCYPYGITAIGTDLYVADCDNHCVRRVTAAGVVTTFAGTTGATSGHVDDTGTAARFNAPIGITAIGTDLYVADCDNHCIRRVTAAGVVTTFAGTTGATSGHVDDTGTAARFTRPYGITAIGTDLYVAEYGNNCIRKVTAAGVVTTFAGTTDTTSGHVDDTGTAARFYYPVGITAIGTDLYVVEHSNHCIRRVTAAGVVTTFAGTTGTTSGHVDDTGTAARFRNPAGITAIGTDLYVVEYGNNCIRKVTAAGVVTTHSGDAAQVAAPIGHTDNVLTYQQSSATYTYGPVIAALGGYYSPELRALIVAAWNDPLALFRLMPVGDVIFPLSGDSVGYRKVA